jgi:hypothetical protein
MQLTSFYFVLKFIDATTTTFERNRLTRTDLPENGISGQGLMKTHNKKISVILDSS